MESDATSEHDIVSLDIIEREEVAHDSTGRAASARQFSKGAQEVRPAEGLLFVLPGQ
jgi:hypothetical protein